MDNLYLELNLLPLHKIAHHRIALMMYKYHHTGNIIKLSPAKSYELDPLPTWLLKECIAELVPTITDIVNMSLRDSDAQIT